MTWMQFTLELVDKLVWPLFLLVSLIILQKPISLLIPAAKRLKYKEFELEFGEELDSIRNNLPEVPHEASLTESEAELLALARTMPNAAVLDSWEMVDHSASRLIRLCIPNVDLDVEQRYKNIENLLGQHQLIAVEMTKLFGDLRQLRNKVAHAKGFRIDAGDAANYVSICFRLIRALTQAIPKE